MTNNAHTQRNDALQLYAQQIRRIHRRQQEQRAQAFLAGLFARVLVLELLLLLSMMVKGQTP